MGSSRPLLYLDRLRSVGVINCATAEDVSEERAESSRLLKRFMFIHDDLLLLFFPLGVTLDLRTRTHSWFRLYSAEF